MPHFSFLSLAAVAGGVAYLMWKKQNAAKTQALQEVKLQQDLLPSPARAQETKELGWDDVTPIDMIGLEVGYRLIPLVDRNQGGQLLARIKGVRKKLSQDLGFLMPTVHIRNNLDNYLHEMGSVTANTIQTWLALLLLTASLYQGRVRGSKPSGILLSGRMVNAPWLSPGR